ncbi:threonine/serine ThrE exporter family protein [Pseudoxanthomonas dokdonensis]|uniref:Membrane protein n=1 Tax=Pseudoxanthomonas dokdonensis TaxID=344882 RepID=A0A0R0CT52_9GAMM|nr:threonine/serine exporter family protein [Pseudoxanthomonas dokdonensis]KRG69634.1 membrane protein [Pseudoxanthomonas dokdonensis]
MTDTSAATTYAQRVGFVSEMASRLHRYGTTAQRMESTVIALSQRLGVDCEPWSSPTGIILSFNDPTRPLGATDTTRVLRLGLGETDLNKLSETDRIAEDVVAGKMSVADGHSALRKLDTPASGGRRLLELLASGLASAAVAALWRLPWLDIATAGIIGLLIGLLFLFIERRPQMKEAGDAIAALVASGVTLLVANFVAPLNLNTVIIASLIVLLPGMALTNSVNELTSQHLVSGIARFAGAMATILKLTVGSVLAVTLAQLLGLYPEVRALRPQPDWVEWTALVLAAYAFAVLFRAHRRDYVWVITASIIGYVISRSAGAAWGSPAGIFLSALVVTAGGNAFARWANRPGAIIRVPGILMLVPGSASLRGLMSLVQQQDMGVGQSALLGVMNIVMALIAGLLFGNLLVSARKNL